MLNSPCMSSTSSSATGASSGSCEKSKFMWLDRVERPTSGWISALCSARAASASDLLAATNGMTAVSTSIAAGSRSWRDARSLRST